MKNILTIFILITSLYSCKAQTPVVSLDIGSRAPNGAYIKDINNELNKFVGTWVYNNGTNIFTLTLKKVEMYEGLNFYEDLLVGEYSYSESGTEIVNSLNLIDDPSIAEDDHSVYGNSIRSNNNLPRCNICDDSVRRITLFFSDPNFLEYNHLDAVLTLQHLGLDDLTGEVRMKASLVDAGGGSLPTATSPTEYRVPYGDYIMVKQ